MFRKSILTAVMVGVGLLGMSASAEAAFSLRLTQGATVVEVTDGGAGDANAATGAITFIGTVGTFTTNVTTGLADPVLDMYNLDLNTVDVSTTTGGTLTIELTRTGYPAAVGLSGLRAEIGGTTQGTVSYEYGYDLGNGAYSFASGSGTGDSPLGPGAFADTDTIDANLSNANFSISTKATIVHGAGTRTTSFDLMVSPMPAPAGIVLLLASAPVLGGYHWLRRRKGAVAQAKS